MTGPKNGPEIGPEIGPGNAGDTAAALLDFLPEPTFILDRAGAILGANRAAQRAFGCGRSGGRLAELVAAPEAELARYLDRAGRVAAGLPAAFDFRDGDATRRYRTLCARLGGGGGGGAALALRCQTPQRDEFAALAGQVRHLNQELRRRIHEKAVVEEALRENQNLARELQHRVKNNVQMMISLLSVAEAESAGSETGRVLAAARARLGAMGVTQDLLYRQTAAGAPVPARELLERLLRTLGEAAGAEARLELDVDEIVLAPATAQPLALIVNELVVNAIKHGAGAGGGGVSVALTQSAGAATLTVRDDGPGFPADLAGGSRTSGLALVRGFCRQIGATLSLKKATGAQRR